MNAIISNQISMEVDDYKQNKDSINSLNHEYLEAITHEVIDESTKVYAILSYF